MNEQQFQEIFKNQISLCEKTLLKKGSEYAYDADRLHNFKVAAALQGETQAQALGGMLSKHIVSIFDMIRDGKSYSIEMWDEKIGDAMNYLILLKAILIEGEALYLQSTKNIKEQNA